MIFVVNYTALGVNNELRIYYARNVLGNAGLMGTLTLCFILPKMIGNLLFPPIAKALGKWKSMMIGYAIEILGLLIMTLTPASFPTAVIGLICLGIGGIPHNAGLFAIGMVCLAFCNLDKKLPEIHKDLEERKAKASN